MPPHPRCWSWPQRCRCIHAHAAGLWPAATRSPAWRPRTRCCRRRWRSSRPPCRLGTRWSSALVGASRRRSRSEVLDHRLHEVEAHLHLAHAHFGLRVGNPKPPAIVGSSSRTRSGHRGWRSDRRSRRGGVGARKLLTEHLCGFRWQLYACFDAVQLTSFLSRHGLCHRESAMGGVGVAGSLGERHNQANHRVRSKGAVRCRVAYAPAPNVTWKGGARFLVSPSRVTFRIRGRHKVCVHRCNTKKFN
jgi:hypothetical protein